VTKPEQTADQFIELLQRFVHLRPRFAVPKHIARFKKQMEGIRHGGTGDPEDRFYFLRIFIILSHSESPPTMGELSADLGIPLSSATRIINWLVKAGFIERIQDPSDRRVVRVEMTKQARHFYQTAIDYNKQRISHLMQRFSAEERSQLLHLMGKLLDVLEEEN
jgi:DNA-binding MarR family transcriptional regulator